MPLPAKAFQLWLHGVAPTASTADICRISGIKRTTLAQQLVRGRSRNPRWSASAAP
ncbi:hypothetical protein PJ267_10105 [Arthrobacter sp. OVS8]|nr:hypothetical protein PJ267_10105 [Arthrobacter sp. OVS8]